MPLDGHAYLVSQGWTGKGTALRQGAIARPLTVAQKKTLSGVGKDRDEAFPFWDHVFQAAAVNIQVKLHKDDDDSDSADTPESTTGLQRTSTGIISNRRPPTGTPAASGTSTPNPQNGGSTTPRLSVMATAKQEAAKRMLYANFFRGPIIGQDDAEYTTPEAAPSTSLVKQHSADALMPDQVPRTEKKVKKKRKAQDAPVLSAESKQKDKKKEKTRDKDIDVKEDKAERRRRRKEAKERAALATDEDISTHGAVEPELDLNESETSRRKKRKEEKRARKEARSMNRNPGERSGDAAILSESFEDRTVNELAASTVDPLSDVEAIASKRKRSRTASDEPHTQEKMKKKRRKTSP